MATSASPSPRLLVTFILFFSAILLSRIIPVRLLIVNVSGVTLPETSSSP